MLDLDELEAKAKAALSANPGAGQWDYDQGRDELNAGGFIVADVWDESCGEFIAAANPAIVLDLIRELREARARIAMVLEWFGRESSIIYELSESIRVDIAQAAAAEREACAHRLEARAALYTKDGTVGRTIASCAALIRARGAKGGE